MPVILHISSLLSGNFPRGISSLFFLRRNCAFVSGARHSRRLPAPGRAQLLMKIFPKNTRSNKTEPWNLTRIPVTRSPRKTRAVKMQMEGKLLREYGAEVGRCVEELGHVCRVTCRDRWLPRGPGASGASVGAPGSFWEASDAADQLSLNYGDVLCLPR